MFTPPVLGSGLVCPVPPPPPPAPPRFEVVAVDCAPAALAKLRIDAPDVDWDTDPPPHRDYRIER